MLKINTYHCHCTTHLLTTTHTLLSLPVRQTSSTSQDIILPIPSSPPPTNSTTLPLAGYTTLHSLIPSSSAIIIRKEDGFEKRVLYRCERCRLVVGYTIPSSHPKESELEIGRREGEEMDGEADSSGFWDGGYKGKVMYLLPGGLIGSEFLDKTGIAEGGKKLREEDVEIGKGGVVVFE